MLVEQRPDLHAEKEGEKGEDAKDPADVAVAIAGQLAVAEKGVEGADGVHEAGAGGHGAEGAGDNEPGGEAAFGVGDGRGWVIGVGTENGIGGLGVGGGGFDVGEGGDGRKGVGVVDVGDEDRFVGVFLGVLWFCLV